MKLLDHKAATHLFKHVQELEESSHDIWRCIYLNLASKKAKCNPELRAHFVVDYLEEELVDADGEIFICDDGDIFILFKGALRPIVTRLGSHIKDFKPELLWEQPRDELFTIFDLSKYWALFFRLCKAKYQQLDAPDEFPVIPEIPQIPPEPTPLLQNA
jgi:hypothetical protein